MIDVVVRADRVLTMVGEGLGIVEQGAVGLSGGSIAYVGPAAGAPDAARRVDGSGCALLPALVECHTHAVWAGSRADELARRLAGESYTAILEGGGGILSTVRATRSAGLDVLVDLAARRLAILRDRGVGTVEVKSGYGLTPEHERLMLVAAKLAGERAGVRVVRTFLGAHTVPAELRGDRSAYVDQVVGPQLELCAPEADGIDVYVDRGAFTLDEGERILRAGAAKGLDVRVHAEQVAFTGAAAMAAKLGALSADHLERIDDDGIAAMAAHGTVAVMLPGAMLYLKDTPPPVGKLREAGVAFAVATDLNPGTSPVADPWLCGTLAFLTMGLTPDEVLRGLTVVAARALRRPELGVLRVGSPGPVVLVRPPPGEPSTPAALVQSMGTCVVEVVR